MALPVISGRKLVKALAKVGFNVAGRRGSHIKLKRNVDDKVFVVIVPDPLILELPIIILLLLFLKKKKIF